MLAAARDRLRFVQAPDHKAGQLLYDLLEMYELERTLEIGALHKACCSYAAAAHGVRGRGDHLVLDYDATPDRTLAVTKAVKQAGLLEHCTFDLSPVSLHWRLMKLLSHAETAPFDLCFVAGRQTWSYAGLSALTAIRLLRVGGWLLLADAEYTYASDPSAPEYLLQGMSDEERRAPQVNLVFSQLVVSDPAMGNAVRIGKLLLAQKQHPVADRGNRGWLKRSAALNAAYTRAGFDPDFRRELLDRPHEVLARLAATPAAPPTVTRVWFHDRPHGRMVLPAEHREELHILLPDPVWQAAITERELEQLIRDAREQLIAGPVETA